MTTTQRPVHTIEATIEYLCSDECLPRLPGTPGGDNARRFVEQAFADIGLEPAGEDGYLQPIPEISGANVIGRIPGRSDRHLVIAAHFDACAIDGGINVGASDNAASVGVLIEVARRLIEDDPLERGVVVIGLDSEEPPFFQGPTMGSRHFVANPTVPLASIDLMICLDMVGHAIGDGTDTELAETLVVFGAEKSPEASRLLASTPEVDGLVVRRLDIDLIDQVSDHAAFQDAGIPFLFYNALRNEHYHAPSDTPATLMPVQAHRTRRPPGRIGPPHGRRDGAVHLRRHPSGPRHQHRHPCDAGEDPARAVPVRDQGIVDARCDGRS